MFDLNFIIITMYKMGISVEEIIKRVQNHYGLSEKYATDKVNFVLLNYIYDKVKFGGGK